MMKILLLLLISQVCSAQIDSRSQESKKNWYKLIDSIHYPPLGMDLTAEDTAPQCHDLSDMIDTLHISGYPIIKNDPIYSGFTTFRTSINARDIVHDTARLLNAYLKYHFGYSIGGLGKTVALADSAAYFGINFEPAPDKSSIRGIILLSFLIGLIIGVAVGVKARRGKFGALCLLAMILAASCSEQPKQLIRKQAGTPLLHGGKPKPKPCPPDELEYDWDYRNITKWNYFTIDGREIRGLVTVVEGDSISYYVPIMKYKYDTTIENADCGKTIYVNGAYAKELKSKK